jgi:glutathione S-transferase
MKLYSAPVSPNAARVRLAIYRKGLDIEIVPPPGQGLKDPAYLAINPLGQIPTLDLGEGRFLTESLAILEYLEERFPEPALLPADLEARALVRRLMIVPDAHVRPFAAPLFGQIAPERRDPERIAVAFENIHKGFALIDRFLGDGTYAVGDAPSLADCVLVPILTAVTFLGRRLCDRDVAADHPRLAAYWQAAQEDPVHARVIAEQLAQASRF